MTTRERAEEIAEEQLKTWPRDAPFGILRTAIKNDLMIPAIERAFAVPDIHARGNLARRIQEIRSAVAPLLRDAPGMAGYIATIDGICHDVQEVERERDEARADVATLTKWDGRKTRRIAELEAALRHCIADHVKTMGACNTSKAETPTTGCDCCECVARAALSPIPAQPTTAAKQNHVGDIDDTHFDGDDCPAALSAPAQPPTHTDRMVYPESLDEWMCSCGHGARRHLDEMHGGAQPCDEDGCPCSNLSAAKRNDAFTDEERSFIRSKDPK